MAPAISAPISRARTRLSFSVSGTSPDAMRLSKSFGNGGFSHSGLADEHRVVLGPSGQHLDDTANFVITSDNGVQFFRTGKLGEVAG